MARGINIKAENFALIRDGKILFETTDTKATSGIRWKTVGFTIAREKCLVGGKGNGGDPTKLKHASIILKDEWKQERSGENSVYVTFTIPKSVVSTALIKAGMDGIKHDDVLYLNGIFQVTHNGKDYGSKKYTLPDIQNAEAWANPEDFRDRFDVLVFYKAPDEPICIEYKTTEGDVIEKNTYPITKWVKPGENISVTLSEEKMFLGRKYKLCKSYMRNYLTQSAISGSGLSTQKGNTIAQIKNRTTKQRVGGTQFVAVMKEVRIPKLESEKNLISEWEEPVPQGIISADDRDAPVYDVEAGIPATESLYLNVISKDTLFGYEFENVVGEKTYEITISKTYKLKWYDITYDENFDVEYVPRKLEKTVNRTVTVIRQYSYWKLKQLEYYKIKNAKIKNGALENGSYTLSPKEYQVPDADYCQYAEQQHVKEPEYQKNLVLPSETIEGEIECPELPVLDFHTIGETAIGEINVRNDKLQLGNVKISESEWKEKIAKKPIKYQYEKLIGKDVLYQSGLHIPKDTANKIYETNGVVTYESVAHVGDVEQVLKFGMEEMNDVTVHTPVVCEASISDARNYNQQVTPDVTKKQLVLDRSFSLCLTTEGTHLPIKGYGFADYGKYTEERQVLIPFDVYAGTFFYPANTWITVNHDIMDFYIPIWVKEQSYTIECRAVSISAKAQDTLEMDEERANLQLKNYVASFRIPVQVSGRLYGFQITDISDYPNWYSVFRKEGTLEPSGISYSVGTQDQNGLPKVIDTKQILPVLNGSHLYSDDIGVTPSGYTFRFTLETVGALYGEDDYLQLTPTFYYVSRDGTVRQEADIYYMETIDGTFHPVVKVGSEQDLHNCKRRYLGNPYLGVTDDEFTEKERLTGKTKNEIRYKTVPMFTFHHVLLSDTFRTYTGRNYAPGGIVPSGVDEETMAMSKQKWYGEYYLPSRVYAVPKGYDVKAEEEKSGGFHFHEDFWLKNGYIMIQFDIAAIKDNKRYLSYINTDNANMGFCNMWRQEGFHYQRTDVSNVVWNLKDGDSFLYQTDRCVGNDYFVGGTH